MRQTTLKFGSFRQNSESTCKDCSCYSVSDLFKICASNQQLPSLKHYSYPQTECSLDVQQPNINHLGSLIMQSEQLQAVFDKCKQSIDRSKAQIQQQQIDAEVDRLVNQRVEEQIKIASVTPKTE